MNYLSVKPYLAKILGKFLFVYIVLVDNNLKFLLEDAKFYI